MNEQVLNEARKMIVGFLRNRREELGMTQQELADKIGYNVRTVERLENGHFWPRLNTLLKLCHHLNCFFFIEEKERNSDTAKTMRERWSRKGDEN